MSIETPHVPLESELDVIVERLERRFDSVEPTTVEAIVQSCASHFEGVPVQTFVPLLAEKRARDHLRALTAA